MLVDFNEMAASSRVWVYQAVRRFSEQEADYISSKLTGFLSNWQAHGQDLRASFLIKYDQFIVIAVDEGANMATGCSIDASVHLLQQLEKELHLELMNKMLISYRDGSEIATISMQEFKEYISEQKVNAETIVFNNLVNSKAAFDSDWEISASRSWHARFLN